MEENPVLQASQRRKTGLRRFLAEFASGMAGTLGPSTAEKFGRPDLEDVTLDQLRQLLQEPEREARTEELKAQAQQRLNIPGQKSEEFNIFQQAVRNVSANPLVRFGIMNPLERNRLINEEFEILKASRGGKVAPSLLENATPGVQKPVPVAKGKIRVRVKSTGGTGTIDEKDFKADLFDRL